MVQSNNLLGPTDPPREGKMQWQLPEASLHCQQVRQGGIKARSSTDPTIAAGEKEQDQQQPHLHDLQQEQQSRMSGRESTTEIPEKPDRKPKVKWPKASDKEAWGSFDESLYTTLQSSLRGSIMAKPNSFGHIINEEGRERFGHIPQRRVVPRQSGRWERKILQLLKEW